MESGQRVTWLHEMRGGYGYVERIPAEIVHVTRKRVRIRVQRLNGEYVERTVKPEHIRESE